MNLVQNDVKVYESLAWAEISPKTSNKYRKILIISPGLIFVQKAFLLGLYSGELIFGGACCWKEFCISKWVWLVNKNS